MIFKPALVQGILIQRYKRFLADIELDGGSVITAHVPNPGAMLGLIEPGFNCWLSYDPKPTRKLPFTWELVEVPDERGGFTVVGLNTHLPNKLVAEALEADAIPELTGYAQIRREVKYGEASRVDFLLSGPDRPACWLEIKNCHMSRGDRLAEFPDCVAARSAKHLRELEAMVAAGDRAVVLFTVQRQDCDRFAAARDIDPKFATALDEAAASGVEVLVYECAMSLEGVQVGRRIPWTG